ncbi:SAM-dependent methyltransferase [Sphingomonas naasensis]|uniref:Class I SAM-dependent methyltransferase n=1 Tax=Sphingomonas naasensis TaxID=1344951 RepID=A0A4S1W531_9SPHN|nr:class I SAM-dependent methyltransferase [Sphingomonas naasensis]NIJ20030.1 SAM-dependent methyltransferase [Sphingomonas naasensis]TGX37974.1 class I SAM-dependent methyltransferase [Sphingomonas naasensis]
MSAFLHRSCPACGAGAARPEAHSPVRAETMSAAALRPYWSGLFSEKRFFTYHRCLGCGLLYTPAFFDGAQLADLYSSMAPNMELVSNDAIAATQKGYFDAAAAHATLDGGYLEIGPDTGHIVREAATRGAFDHFWLFEPNRAIHDTLRASAGGRPARLLTDMDDLSPVPDGSIGLAVMVHVLDHLLDPLAMLAQIRAKLRPGGTLLIVTHNEKSLLRSLMGTRWPPFCLQHPELYNPATITALLGRAGYGGVRVARSRNYFPLPFLARQALWTLGLKPARVPLPNFSLGLRLGNMLTLARAPAQAATGTDPWREAAE